MTPWAGSRDQVECIGVVNVVGIIVVDYRHRAGAPLSHHACCHALAFSPVPLGGLLGSGESVVVSLITGELAVDEYPPVSGRRAAVSTGVGLGPPVSESE